VEILSKLSEIGGVIATAIVVVLAVIAITRIFRLRRRVPPNEALIVFGRGGTIYDEKGQPSKQGARVVTAGGTFIIPFMEEAETLDLRVMTIEETGDKVITKPGVAIILEWVCQLQITPSEQGILTAARAFLGMTPDEIKAIAKDTLSGNFREVVAQMTPEAVHREKEEFGQKVVEYAASEMARLGLTINSLNIREISDMVGYYEALGRPQIAEVKKNATIAEAEAGRDSRIKSAQAKETAEKAEIASDLSIARAQKDKDVQVAQFKAETDAKKAAADAAYSLAEEDKKKEIEKRKGAVAAMVQEQAALAAEQAIAVAERTQEASVVVPAKAREQADRATADGVAYKAETEARGAAKATKLAAEADAEKTRLTKTAEADGVEALGAANAGAEEAKLRATAAGERDLAAARAAEGRVNIQELALRLYYDTEVKKAEAIAAAAGQMLRDVKLTYVGGSPDASGGSNPIAETVAGVVPTIAQMVAQVTGMTGMSVGEILAEVMALGKVTETTEAGETAGDAA